MADSQSSRKNGRGISYKHDETVDLISLWCREKVQMQLRENHRNIDVFENIAVEMREKEHYKTPGESRTKSEALRRKFKEANQKASRSGSSVVTMPFFQELKQILAGDASVEPNRLMSAMEVILIQPGTSQHNSAMSTYPNSICGSQELFPSEILQTQDADREVELILVLEEVDPQQILQVEGQLQDNSAVLLNGSPSAAIENNSGKESNSVANTPTRSTNAKCGSKAEVYCSISPSHRSIHPLPFNRAVSWQYF